MTTETISKGDAQGAKDAASTPLGILHLGAGLEIKDVENVHKQLTALLGQGSNLKVDISHVSAMDTAGVQLILAFQSEAAKRGVGVDYTGKSNAFTRALTAVGLGDAVRHVASRD